MKILILVTTMILFACSTMRQRTLVVTVYEYPYNDYNYTDTVTLAKDSVLVKPMAAELKKQENKKNFWKGTTATLVVLLIIELLVH